jgi:iron complex outermembrane recepter protein
MIRYPSRYSISAVCVLFALPAVADAEEKFILEEVVVTAQKREQNLFDIPIAISAFTGDQLDRAGIEDLQDLTAMAPGLKTSPSPGGGGTILIRGVGTGVAGVGADPNIAIYRDGVYVPRHSIAFQDFIDIERVEVLRGPQGTLYGRNATGGAINIISKTPGDEWTLDGRLDGGRYDQRTAAIAVGGPVIDDKILLRGSYVRSQEESFIENVFDPGAPFREKVVDSSAFNGSLIVNLSDDLEVVLRADYEEDDGFGVIPIRKTWLGPQNIADAGPIFGVPQILTDDRLQSNQDFANTGDAQLRNHGASSTITWSLNDYTVKSITGYRYFESTRVYDGDGSNSPIATTMLPEKSESISQELQLLSPSGGVFEWVLGGFYYDEDTQGLARIGGPVSYDLGLGDFGLSGINASVLTNFDSQLGTEAWAVFAQGTYNISDHWRATVGLRYSEEEKTFSTTSDSLRAILNQDEIDTFLAGPIAPLPSPIEGLTLGGLVNIYTDAIGPSLTAANTDKASFDAFTPRLVLEWLPSDDYLVYASVSRGFKSGGFNAYDTGPLNVLLNLSPLPASGDPADAFQDSYDQEELWSYEAGLRATLLEGRLRAASTLFYYDYSDLQVQTSTGNSTTGFRSVISNDASADIHGVELELTAEPIDRLQLVLNASWTQGEFDQFSGVSDAVDGAIVDMSGFDIPLTPEWRAFASAQYSFLLNGGAYGILMPRLAVEYESSQNFLLSTITSESDPRFSAQAASGIGDLSTVNGGERTVVDVSLSYILPNADVTVTAYVDNVFDDTYRVGMLSDSSAGQQEILADPRVYGARVIFSF